MFEHAWTLTVVSVDNLDSYYSRPMSESINENAPHALTALTRSYRSTKILNDFNAIHSSSIAVPRFPVQIAVFLISRIFLLLRKGITTKDPHQQQRSKLSPGQQQHVYGQVQPRLQANAPTAHQLRPMQPTNQLLTGVVGPYGPSVTTTRTTTTRRVFRQTQSDASQIQRSHSAPSTMQVQQQQSSIAHISAPRQYRQGDIV